jgi:hypothetical protein
MQERVLGLSSSAAKSTADNVRIAYIFNRHCGPIPFEVKGLGRNCRTYGSYTSTLEFRRAKLDGANQYQEPLTGLPAAIASKPEQKADVSPTEGGEVPSPPVAQRATRDDRSSTPKKSSAGFVDSTGISASTGQTSVPNDAQRAKDLNKYLWGAAFTVMIVWLLIKLFGKTLIGMK